MKSFVREKHDEILIGICVLVAGIFVIAGALVSELAYLVFYALLAVLFAAQKLRLRRRERAKAPTGANRSTGSR